MSLLSTYEQGSMVQCGTGLSASGSTECILVVRFKSALRPKTYFVSS